MKTYRVHRRFEWDTKATEWIFKIASVFTIHSASIDLKCRKDGSSYWLCKVVFTNE